jgi:hypothetical protein
MLVWRRFRRPASVFRAPARGCRKEELFSALGWHFSITGRSARTKARPMQFITARFSPRPWALASPFVP